MISFFSNTAKKFLSAFALSLLSIISTSCGPNKAEMTRLAQHRADSMKAIMQRKMLLANELRNTQANSATLRDQLKIAQAKLETHLSSPGDHRPVQQESLQSLEAFIAQVRQKIKETDDRIFSLEREVQQYQ